MDDFGSKIAYNTLLAIDGYTITKVDGQVCVTITKYTIIPNTVIEN